MEKQISHIIEFLLIGSDLIIVAAIIYCQILEIKKRNDKRANDYGFKTKNKKND